MTVPETTSLQARFRIERGAFVLDVALELPGRGVTALFGPSGSGKTTLLRAIAGLERAHGGFVAVNREVWQDEARGHFTPVHQRALGYVFQEANLFPHLSVRANLEFGRRRSAARALAPPVDVDRIIAMLGIEGLLDRAPENLSGGERQRVAIARALLAGPRVLLLDEPLASLDLERKSEILPYLERLHEELAIPVLYVSHAPDEVLRLADHLVLLSAGRVVASGPLRETLARIDLPEMLSRDVGVVIDGVVAAVNEAYGLLELEVRGGRLQVAHAAVPVGRRLRVQIQSRDVSLALEMPRETSVLNLLPATVVRENEVSGAAHVHVLLDAGGMPLIARITRLSRDRLRLAPGIAVWAQIKAVAVVA